MHWRACCVFLLLVLTPVQAQVASWSDNAGDQQVTYGPSGEPSQRQPVQNDQGWYPRFDIVRAGIYEETAYNIVFEMVVQDTKSEGSEPEHPFFINHMLYFTFHGESMRANSFFYIREPLPDFAIIERLEGEIWQELTWLTVEAHPDAEGWTMTVPKNELRDGKMIPARADDELSGIYAQAVWPEQSFSFAAGGRTPCPGSFGGGDQNGCGFNAYDEAGTNAAPLGAYTLVKSPPNDSSILLEVDRPFRASNGLATTYVFSMRVINTASEVAEVHLSGGDVPSGWDLYLPQKIELEPDEVKTVRIAIGVPFGHKHGESESVSIIGKNAAETGATTRTDITVFWPEIAQPSGHHPRIYFHGDGYYHWMNTISEETRRVETGVLGASQSCRGFCLGFNEDGAAGVQGPQYYWYPFLSPGLFTGLDFIVDKPITGNLEMAIESTVDVTAFFELYQYYEERDPLLIGSQEQQLSFVGGEIQSIPLNMDVNNEADRLPFEEYSTLVFNIRLIGEDDGTQSGERSFQSASSDMEYSGELYSHGSYVDLPLLDYHEQVDPGLIDSLTRLQLEAPDEVVRPVNPGRTAAFFFEVVNKGDQSDTVEWHVEGPNSEWATTVPAFSKVAPNGKATVAIRVDVPENAVQGDVADLLLVGESVEDPDTQVFGQFLAYVETFADIPDESDRFAELQNVAQETEARGTPFPAIMGLAALALALAIRRRA